MGPRSGGGPPAPRSHAPADWLCAYREIATITEALTRIGGRLRRPTDLAASVPILVREYEAFRTDFANSFPS
ncbi:MAG: ACP phosphodiesterase [Chthoniobacter sp.]